jgi:hypothetical protein
LQGVDTETYTPADATEAHGAVQAVSRFCHDYCPVRLQCVEERCKLYRLEARALAVIRPSVTDSVGVLDRQVIGL